MMELVGKLRSCFFSCFCKGDARSRLGGAKYFVSTDLNLNRAFLLTWPVARKIYYSKKSINKRKEDCLGYQDGHRFLIGLGLTNISKLTSSAEGS